MKKRYRFLRPLILGSLLAVVAAPFLYVAACSTWQERLIADAEETVIEPVSGREERGFLETQDFMKYVFRNDNFLELSWSMKQGFASGTWKRIEIRIKEDGQVRLRDIDNSHMFYGTLDMDKFQGLVEAVLPLAAAHGGESYDGDVIFGQTHHEFSIFPSEKFGTSEVSVSYYSYRLHPEASRLLAVFKSSMSQVSWKAAQPRES